MPNSLRVAVVQAEVAPTFGEGLDRTTSLAHAARANGAQLIVFPETWLPGYPAWLDVCRDVALWDHAPTKAVFARHAAESVDVRGEQGAALAALARELGATLVIGVTERVSSGIGRGTLYNTLLTYGADGQLLNHHRKLVPTYTERMVWGNGDADGLRAVDIPGARVGGLICWEHWMPLARQALHVSGEDVHVAVWPTVHDNHQLTSRHYALEGRCYVLAAGSLMRAASLPAELEPHEDRIHDSEQFVLRGGSAIIAPDGTYVVEPVFGKPAILEAELDLSVIRREQMALDVAGHYNRPDCFEFSVRRGDRLSS